MQPHAEANSAHTFQNIAAQVLTASFYTSRDSMILFRAGDEVNIDVNGVWCQTTGYHRHDVNGKSRLTLNIWDNISGSERLTASIRKRCLVQDFACTFRRHLPDGQLETGYALLNAYPVTLHQTTYFLLVGHNISEQRRTEMQRQQVQKLERLGQLAGEVAHDFINILTVIKAHAQMMAVDSAEGRVTPYEDVVAIQNEHTLSR